MSKKPDFVVPKNIFFGKGDERDHTFFITPPSKFSVLSERINRRRDKKRFCPKKHIFWEGKVFQKK
jgi:hypothetical protein